MRECMAQTKHTNKIKTIYELQHKEHIHISLVYMKPVKKSWNEHHINCFHIDAKSKKHTRKQTEIMSTDVEQIKTPAKEI